MNLTFDQLRAWVSYDPQTGLLTWLKSPNRRIRVGSIAGTNSRHSRVALMLGGQKELAHRIAWTLMTGRPPAGVIDHINGNGHDNRWVNLRDVSQSVNMQNRRTSASHNKAGFLGVCTCSKSKVNPYISAIVSNGKRIILGRFNDPAVAHQTYVAAKRQLHEGNML